MPCLLDNRRCLTAIALAALGLVATAPATAAAGPQLSSARAVDADSDGSVDAFDLRFSARVRGRAQVRGPFAFKVRGWRVTGVAKPSGRRLRVSVAERAGCDVGARARLAYRPRGKASRLTDGRGRPVRASLVDMARRDRRRPRIVCAVTSDSDGNGHLDAVVLTYSGAVRSRAIGAGPFPFRVDRYAVTSVDRASGRNLTVHLRERPAFDTGEVPAVIYRRPAKRRDGVSAARRRRARAASTTFNDTRDRARPRLVSATTSDADGDGLLDGVDARFSEPVDARPDAVTVAGGEVTAVTGGESDALAVKLAEGTLGSGALPELELGGGAPVSDLAGNAMARTAVTPTDGAPPVITGIRTLDRDGAPGRLDTIAVSYSEAVLHLADSDGSYPFSVSGYRVVAVDQATGPGLELRLEESAGLDSGAVPAVSYTRGVGTPVLDLAGNEAVPQTLGEGSGPAGGPGGDGGAGGGDPGSGGGSGGGAADGIAPVLLGATTLDSDADGRLDGVSFQFSEPVRHDPRSCATGCGFTIAGAGLSAQQALAATGSSVVVTVDESESNSGTLPSFSYDPAGGAVTDLAGNVAAAGAGTAGDGAPPVLTSAQTADVDANGRIDRVEVGFSEPVSHTAGADVAAALAAAGYAAAGVQAGASPSSLAVVLTEAGAPDTGAAPAMTYAGTGGAAVRDASGLEPARRSYPGLTRDAAAPVLLGAPTTADLDGNGRIDTVELAYSEELAGAPPAGAFDVAGRSIVATDFAGDRVALTLAEVGAGFDTDATPAVAYTPAVAGDPTNLRDVPEGPGDTADEVAGLASVVAADGAAPSIVSAATGDADFDGIIDGVDLSFSEPVTHTGSGPVAIGLSDGLVVASISPASGSAFELALTPAPAPNGGVRPVVTVSEPERVRDAAANPAAGAAFAGATDGVSPVLVGGRTGEESGSECGDGPVDGIVDCVRGQWSEPVTAPTSSDRFSILDFTLDGVLPAPDPPAPRTDLTVVPGSQPDRDVESSMTYTAGQPGEVVDLAGNPGLTATVAVAAACTDPSPTTEPNETFALDNPLLGPSVPEQGLCIGDVDWFRIAAAGGEVSVAVDPAPGLALTMRLYDSAQTLVAEDSSITQDAPVVIQAVGLADPVYWLEITGPSQQEGGYCINPAFSDGEGCGGGPPIDT